METKKTSLTYKDAGVNIDAGNDLVNAIKPTAKSTARPGVMGGLGGFGALFDLKASGYRDPILVSSTDGVGTKLKLAFDTGIHHTVGIDLVAMCVNDLIVQGAEPLFFLDYFATSGLRVDQAAQVIEGIAEGCRQAGCALIGGETAEMPGLYQQGEYDLAGFAVGAVERDQLLPKHDIAPGDILIGLPSSGVHSNGFSLVRRILEYAGVSLDDPTPFDKQTSFKEVLLTPTAIYVKPVLQLQRKNLVKGLVHITGGGLLENIPRVLPDGVGVSIDMSAYSCPAIFHWLQDQGNVPQEEMMRTFNMGIGMLMIVAASNGQAVKEELAKVNQPCFEIGQVVGYTEKDARVALRSGR